MINEITCNSNNAIQMSRGELLQWANSLLRINYTKIEQMGSGAAYCHLLDIIYPGKVPLSKVNSKAKFDYEYLNNFKVLQQSFTKLNIMKNIDVEKLVKCKYQDNLEFLQWFKKIFDSTSPQVRECEPQHRRGDSKMSVEKENKNSSLQIPKNIDAQLCTSKQTIYASPHKNSTQVMSESSFIHSFQSREEEESKNKYIPMSADKTDEKMMINLFNEQSSGEKEFYLRKIKEIEHMMEGWDLERSSGELREQIRKIIMVAPGIKWEVREGNFHEVEGSDE